MKKELYDEYVKAWDIWKKRTDEYFQKRVEIIKDKTLRRISIKTFRHISREF